MGLNGRESRGAKMGVNTWKALLYKKYTLKSKVSQVIFIGGLVLVLCLLSLIPIQLNGNTPIKLSLTNLLSILVFFFISCGMLSGQAEINYHESRQLSLLVGKKSKAIIYLLGVDLLDGSLQSLVVYGMIHVFYRVLHSGQEVQLLQMISFIVGANVISFLAYFLTLYFKSTMTSLGILLIFPLIISPYLDRMFPNIVPLIVYNSVMDSIHNSIVGISHLYLFFWLLLVVVLTYLQFRKEA